MYSVIIIMHVHKFKKNVQVATKIFYNTIFIHGINNDTLVE